MATSLFQELESQYQFYRKQGRNESCLGSLATCDPSGQPRVRSVILHDIDEFTVLFLISRLHGKWSQIQSNPKAELLIWWPDALLQFRLTGKILEASERDANDLWDKQNPKAKALDHALGDEFKPADPIESYDSLKAEVNRRSREKDLAPKPDHVVACRLEIDEIDRIKASSEDRLHDRRLARRSGDQWVETQLVP
ncbi:MAG: pyridoxamine 5'-phosphate oxidase family protein [Verrucomicrobiota bacterium]